MRVLFLALSVSPFAEQCSSFFELFISVCLGGAEFARPPSCRCHGRLPCRALFCVAAIAGSCTAARADRQMGMVRMLKKFRAFRLPPGVSAGREVSRTSHFWPHGGVATACAAMPASVWTQKAPLQQKPPRVEFGHSSRGLEDALFPLRGSYSVCRTSQKRADHEKPTLRVGTR